MWPLEDVLRAATAAGFDRVGLDDLTVAGGEPEDVAAVLDAYGLSCTDVGVLRIGAGPVAPQAEALARLASATGAPTCIGALYTGSPAERLPEVRTGAEILDRAGVRLALEFAAYSGLRTLAQAVELCSAVGWERCGVLLDTWHFFRGGAPWELLGSLAAGQIALVHVNDAPGSLDDDAVAASRSHRVPPGQGTFDTAAFWSWLEAVGYDGVVSVEVLSAALRERPPAEGARTLFDSLSALRPGPTARVEMK